MDRNIVEALEKPFPREVLKQTQTRHGTINYVPGVYCAQRLDEVFEGNWEFRILWEPTIGNDFIMVVGELRAGGQVRQAVGAQRIMVRKDDGVVVSVANDIKKAGSNAFKRCCTAFGIGRYLIIGTPNPRQGNRNKGQKRPAAEGPPPARKRTEAADRRTPEASSATTEQLEEIQRIWQRGSKTLTQLNHQLYESYQVGLSGLSQRQAAEFISRLKASARQEGVPLTKGGA